MSVIDDYIAQLQSTSYFDPALAAATRIAQQKAADMAAQYQVGQATNQSAYDQSSYSINKDLDTSLRSLMDNFGSRGTIHSSAYVVDQGKTNEAAQNALSQAALRRTQGNSSLDLARRSGETDLLGMLQSESVNASSRQAQAQAEQARRQEEANYRNQQLDLQRQQNQAQQNYYQQSMAQADQQAAAQRQMQQRMLQAMHPTTSPSGQSSYQQKAAPMQTNAQAAWERSTALEASRGTSPGAATPVRANPTFVG